MKFVVALVAVFLLAFTAERTAAQEQNTESARTLNELLEQVREGSQAEERENIRREHEFAAARDKQRESLTEVLETQAIEEARSGELERAFEDNENKLVELEETLRKRLGTLGEIFGVVRQVAGDTQTRVRTSIISAQIPGREELLVRLAQSRELPSIEDLEKLWLTLQEEMTEQGRIVKFPATVIHVGGEESVREVVRIGPFNAVAGGRYLRFLSESGKLAELGRQPAGRYLDTIEDYESAGAGLSAVAIDPSRGTILSLLVQSPSLEERIGQGGLVGYVILVLGGIGVALALYRLLRLALAGRRIYAQVGDDEHPREDNALGRILSVYRKSTATDTETLELRLDEAILKETSMLRRGTTLIKVLAVVAPLLGLLGTVTGMIETFQAITLFGTGDPKLMAGGISQALVTTVLGLCAAIPLTMLHSVVAERARILIELLEEHSVGMVAEHAESLAVAGT